MCMDLGDASYNMRAWEQNTSSDCKSTVYKQIAQALLPDYYAINATKSGEHIKSKID